MKVVRHSHHEQFLRLANDDAALLVSSGRWVYTSKFEARKVTQRPAGRSLPWRIFMFVTTLAMIIATLLLTTSARAADKPLPKLQPYKVCLTQSQAAQVYKGKRLKYREIGSDKCWYAGARLPKHAFYAGGSPVPSTLAAMRTPRDPESRRGEPAPVNAHPVGTAVSLPRLDTQDTPRVEGQSGSIPEVSGFNITKFTATLVEDAVMALTGVPESFWTFDATWSRAMRDAAGTR